MKHVKAPATDGFVKSAFLAVAALAVAAGVASAEEAGSAARPAEKKRVLVINIPASEKIPKAETEILDGVLCSEVTKLDTYTVICAGNLDETMRFKDFSQQFGGSPCARGQCMEGLVDRYQPDVIVRTTAKKEGADLEVTMKLLNAKGTSTLGALTRTISTKDPRFMAKLGEMATKLLAQPAPPAPTAPPKKEGP